MSVPAYVQRAFDPNLPISMTIHPSDGMFKPGREEHYRRVGQGAAKQIAAILFEQDEPEPRRVLDFGCGFGRVMRHLRAIFPEATMFAADTMRAAIDFCGSEFRSEAVPSLRDLAKLKLPPDLDLIWSGSVMTHLPEAKARELINKFISHLRPGGIAVFTTHGRCAASAFANGKWPYRLSEEAFSGAYTDFIAERYGYVDYEGQQGYGFSLTPGSWITREVAQYSDLRQIAFTERGWDNHQDLVAFSRTPAYRDNVQALVPPADIVRPASWAQRGKA